MDRPFASEVREELAADSPAEGAFNKLEGLKMDGFPKAEELSADTDRVAESGGGTLPRAIKSEEIWEADLGEDLETGDGLTEEPGESESAISKRAALRCADVWEVEDAGEYDEGLEEFFDSAGEFDWLEEGEEFDDEEADYVTQKTTSRIAGRIVQHYEERQPGEIVDEEVRFCLGRDCERVLTRTLLADLSRNQRQKVPQIPIVDGTFIARDGKRVLLEVDDEPRKSAGHSDAHVNAIQAALRHCQQQPNRQECLGQLATQVAQTRSIFVEVAPRSGRNPRASSASAQVRAITRVDYILDPRTGKLATRSRSLPTRNQPSQGGLTSTN